MPLKNKQKANIQQLQEGADFVDFILLNLEAGANIEQSFFSALNNLEKSPLKQNAQKIWTLCQIGLSFGEAINHMMTSEMSDLVLREILEKLSLSLKLGSPLIQILNHLSFHFRLLATSRLEELASEAPVKMIFPLVVFIFPVIFLLLGAGAIENLMSSFNF